MYKKGDIVLIPFPFSDLSGNKVRPALVISQGKVGEDIIVAFITSQKKLKSTHLVSLKPSPENGLKVESGIVCSKLATLEAKIVLGELGRLSKQDLARIDGEVRAVLGL